MTPINVARMWHFHFNVARMWHEIIFDCTTPARYVRFSIDDIS